MVIVCVRVYASIFAVMAHAMNLRRMMDLFKNEVVNDNILTRRAVPTVEAREASKACADTMFDFCHGYQTAQGVSTHSCCHDTCVEGQKNLDFRI